MDDFTAVAGEVVGSEAPRNNEHLPTRRSQNMSLFHCMANGVFGPFGEYIHAASAAEARLKFWRQFRMTPFEVKFERRLK
jgi:hypothetical protein